MILQNEEVPIDSEGDIIKARKTARGVATTLGFGLTDVTRIVTSASELARNIFRYAETGVMRWRILNQAGSVGLELIFEDQGPGIPDTEQAMEEGYSTSGGLGMGLTGCQRLMDEMELQSEVGKGTIVKVRKWMK